MSIKGDRSRIKNKRIWDQNWISIFKNKKKGKLPPTLKPSVLNSPKG